MMARCLSPVMLATVCLWAGFVVGAAQAKGAREACADYQLNGVTALTALRTCSDAYHVRHNVDEADAVCRLAGRAAGQASEQWVHMSDNDPDMRVCKAQGKTMARQLASGLDWFVAWQGYRLDHRNPAPAPFTPPE
jgi:hypothetical protein